MGHSSSRSERQVRAIAALMACRNVAEAAQRAKVGRRTLYRWLATEDFQSALTAAQEEVIESASRQLVGSLSDAVQALRSIAADANCAPMARIQAAAKILEHVIKLRELASYERRLVRLEEKARINR